MHPWCIPLPGIRSLPVPGRLLKIVNRILNVSPMSILEWKRHKKGVQYPKSPHSCTANTVTYNCPAMSLRKMVSGLMTRVFSQADSCKCYGLLPTAAIETDQFGNVKRKMDTVASRRQHQSIGSLPEHLAKPTAASHVAFGRLRQGDGRSHRTGKSYGPPPWYSAGSDHWKPRSLSELVDIMPN